MKKILLLLQFALVLAPSVIASDFRSISWGMSTESVAKREESVDFTKSISDQYGRSVIELTFQETLSGIPMRLVYRFVAEKDEDGEMSDEEELVQAYYSATYPAAKKDAVSDVAYRKDFETAYRLLYKKYGKPMKQDQEWSAIWAHDENSEHISWETSKTRIVLEIAGIKPTQAGNKLREIKIIYTSKKLGYLLKAPIETEKETLKKL